MEDKISFYIELHTPYGIYEGEIFEGTLEHYEGMLEMVKMFYTQTVFDTYLSNGDFLVMNSDMIRQSMIFVKVRNGEE